MSVDPIFYESGFQELPERSMPARLVVLFGTPKAAGANADADCAMQTSNIAEETFMMYVLLSDKKV